MESSRCGAAPLKLGEFIAVRLDNKPASQVQATVFVFSGQDPNREVPPDSGQPKLSGA